MRKVFTRHLFLLILCGLAAGAHAHPAAGGPFNVTQKAALPAEPVRIIQEWFQIPVLKFKSDNPVLRIQMELSEAMTLSEILIGTAGTTRLRDIASIRVYYDHRKNQSPKLNTQSNDFSLFGEARQVRKQTSVPGNRVLQKGTHTFWITYDLTASADITHLIGVRSPAVVLDGKRYVPVAGTSAAEGTTPLLRMGAAVRLHKQDNVHTSRIPGLATTNKGTLLAVFDARRETGRDLQGDIDIGLHRSTDGGNRWEPIRIAMDRGEWGGLPEKFNGISDACILVDKNSDAIYIAGLWMHGLLDPEGNWVEGLGEESKEWNHQWRNKASQPGFDVKRTSQFLIVKSTDDGKTWGEPVNLTRMVKQHDWWLFAPAPGNGITLEDGTLVFPTQGRNEQGRPFSNITYSTDGGKTWVASEPATEAVQVATNECAVAQLTDGSLMLNMRAGVNKGNLGDDNGRGIAVTRDLGKSWQSHPGSFNALPEPTCMASLYRHDFKQSRVSKSILVFSNPNSKQYREDLTIKISLDDGDTWPEKHQLLLDEGRGRGYSCLTSVGEDYIGILYESSQADLVFQKVPLRTLLQDTN